MSDYNKLLWFLCTISINGLICIGVKHVNSKLFDVILTTLFVFMLLSVSVCWVFFDFWM